MEDQVARRVWETALGKLQLQVSRTNFETWLKGTVGLQADNGYFIIGTGSDFTSEWLDSRLRPLIIKTLAVILHESVEVRFQLIGTNGNGVSSTPLFANGSGKATLPSTLMVNRAFTFERYIVGDCNRLAAAAALASSHQPGQLYTPLLIYGSHGLGKTHLLHAVAHQAAALGKSVLYTSGNQFTNEFVQAVAQGKTSDFQSRHRSSQIFLIDDIHFLAGKKQTQEAFLYIFNDLQARGSQITITCDRAPRDITNLSAPLRSRLIGGLVAELQPPDLQSRRLMVTTKAREQHVELPSEVANLIASQATTNLRELEGCLTRVLAAARLNRAPITAEAVSLILPSLLPRQTNGHAQPEAIIDTVATYFDVDRQAIAGKLTSRRLNQARQVAVYLLREDARLSLKEIGGLLSGRTHSTISHSYQKVSSSVIDNLPLQQQLTDLRKRLVDRSNKS